MWAPRRILSTLIERVSSSPVTPAARRDFTNREQQVLALLVAGCPNKEMNLPLGIGVRAVKAPVAKLMHKVGVQNRIALSMHAIADSLISPSMQLAAMAKTPQRK